MESSWHDGDMNSSAPTSVSFFVSSFLSATCSVFVADGACLIVDPGLHVSGQVQDFIEQRDLEVAGIALTHGHLDHVADAAELAAYFDTPVYVGAADEYRLENPLEQLPSAFTTQVAPVFAERGWAKPTRVCALTEGDTVQVGECTLRAWEVPGHTEGSTIYVSDREVRIEPTVGVSPRALHAPGLALTGDVLFAGTIGRTDLPGGDPDAMIRSLSRLRREALAHPHHVIVPGHGPVSTFGDEVVNNSFLSLSFTS